MVQGVVVVNKERDFTSFDVVAVCRRIFGQKAVGHTGTLDPMAEGVLPVCLGRATKLTDMLISAEKSYLCEMELGRATDTDDSTGNEISRADPDILNNVTEEDVKTVLASFVGDNIQVPPRYAAIKINGKKLYEYAREGAEIDVPGRPVSIYAITIREMRLPFISFHVHCSKGTYIRSLCRDVGQKLGTGAVMTGLVREESAGFTLSDSRSLKELEQLKEEGRLNEAVLPMDSLLSGFPALDISPEGEKRLRNGNPLLKEDVGTDELSDGQIYRIYLSGQLAALYSWDENKKQLRNKKMLTDFI